MLRKTFRGYLFSKCVKKIELVTSMQKELLKTLIISRGENLLKKSFSK